MDSTTYLPALQPNSFSAARRPASAADCQREGEDVSTSEGPAATVTLAKWVTPFQVFGSRNDAGMVDTVWGAVSQPIQPLRRQQSRSTFVNCSTSGRCKARAFFPVTLATDGRPSRHEACPRPPATPPATPPMPLRTPRRRPNARGRCQPDLRTRKQRARRTRHRSGRDLLALRPESTRATPGLTAMQDRSEPLCPSPRVEDDAAGLGRLESG